ncbi:hypothetical protein C5Y93_29595 [Blastopirellula marina]|uniref:Uncharacterized protein n=1 Tax=Blastopirellula marina TaxID=124 RepID=A0A2S8GDE2_9BACT|nr:hypothetical protein C5Y93_29595 [Blastopirellula marina]
MVGSFGLYRTVSFQLATILIGILYSGSSSSHGIFGILPIEAQPLVARTTRPTKLITIAYRCMICLL